MTIEEIRARVAKLKTLDSEEAHAAEDALHEDVLEAIEGGAPNAAELAGEALKTRLVSFSRRYA